MGWGRGQGLGGGRSVGQSSDWTERKRSGSVTPQPSIPKSSVNFLTFIRSSVLTVGRVVDRERSMSDCEREQRFTSQSLKFAFICCCGLRRNFHHATGTNCNGPGTKPQGVSPRTVAGTMSLFYIRLQAKTIFIWDGNYQFIHNQLGVSDFVLKKKRHYLGKQTINVLIISYLTPLINDLILIRRYLLILTAT